MIILLQNQRVKFSRTTTRQCWITLLLMVCLIPGIALAEDRTWTRSDDKTKVVAELLGTDGKMVILRKQSDKKLHVVPLTMLSKADQSFVRQKYPQIFPENRTNTGSSKTSLPGQSVPKSSGGNKQAGFRWDLVSKALPRFQPFMIDGVPTLGETTYMMTREQRNRWKDTQSQIGCILEYLSDPDAFQDLARELKQRGVVGAFETGKPEDDENRSDDYGLFNSIHRLFHSIEEHNRLREYLSSKTNEFDKGTQVAHYVADVDKLFGNLNKSSDGIPLSILTSVKLDAYDHDLGGFPMKIRSILRRNIGGTTESVEAVYLDPPEMPAAIKIDVANAPKFARQLEGQKLVIKQDIVLSQLRRELENSGTLVRKVNVKVVRLSLIANNNPEKIFHTWEFNNQPEEDSTIPDDSLKNASDDQKLKQKMESIAKNHKLKTINGYPVIMVSQQVKYKAPHAGSDPKRFSMMLQRVALGLDPDYLNPVFIAVHFPETIGRYIQVKTNSRGAGEIHSAEWKGVSEFDKRETKNLFNKAYSEKINKYAIQLPIRFIEYYAVPLGINGQYDFEREGIYIDHNRLSKKFPKLSSSFRTGKARVIMRWPRPSFVQEFVPMAPAQAKPLYKNTSPRSGGLWGYVKRTVTWDRLHIDNDSSHTLPPVAVSQSSYELYTDPMLKKRLVKLESKELPPVVLSDSKPIILPDRNKPMILDSYSLYFLKHEAAETTPQEEELQKMFKLYLYTKDEKINKKVVFAISNLASLEETYSEIGTIGKRKQEKDEIIERHKKAQDLVKNIFGTCRSRFFPHLMDPLNLSPSQLPELSQKWKNWMTQSIDSNKGHFVVHANVVYDPKSLEATLGTPGSSYYDPYTWEITENLIDKGIAANRFVILNMSELRNNENINFMPCLQLTQSIEKHLSQIPDDIRKTIIERLSGRARVELVIAAKDIKFLKASKKYHSDGLILESQLTSIRLFNDQLLIHEFKTRQNNALNGKDDKKTVSHPKEKTTEITSVQPTVSKEAQPLSPATLLRLIAKYLPEFTDENRKVMMFNRWTQEQNLRSKYKKTVYGVVQKRGLYFRGKKSDPTPKQLDVESKSIVKWLNSQSAVLGDRYTLRFSSEFSELSPEAKGYRRKHINLGDVDDSMRFTSVLNAIGSNISSAKRRLNSSSYQSGGAGGGSGVSGLNLGKSSTSTPTKPNPKDDIKKQKIQKELKEAIKLKRYVESATNVFILTNIGNHFSLSNLKRSNRVPQWVTRSRPGEQDPGEPIHSVLRMNHEIILPETLKIEPGRSKYEIEIEFQIKSVVAQETPPEIFDPKIVGKYRKSLQKTDHGKYVVFDVDVSGAWLIDPTGKKRVHQLALIPVPNKPKGQK